MDMSVNLDNPGKIDQRYPSYFLHDFQKGGCNQASTAFIVPVIDPAFQIIDQVIQR